jgi:phosphatidylglycerol lysyltransferase
MPTAIQPRPRVLSLLSRYGRTTTSFQVLEPGFDYWFAADGDACVAFFDTGGAWVVAGEPLCAPDRTVEVCRRFGDAAAHAGRRVRYFGVERDRSDALHLHHLPIGEQPVWDPRDWSDILRRKRSLREQLRRARAKGVRVRRVSPEELTDPAAVLRRGLDGLIAAWLASRRMAPMGFLVHLDPYGHPEERRFFVAEREGRPVGLLSAVPIYARGGWLFEDILRDPAAPNGTVELLFDHAMRAVADEGCTYATYGLVPLANAELHWLRVVRDRTRGLYDFEGLRRFKAKLEPASWEPVYLAYPAGERGPGAVFDTLRAFACGSLWRFGAATAKHRAARLVRAFRASWRTLWATAPAGGSSTG